MADTIKIRGAIDRDEPDPSSPTDSTRRFIGTLKTIWEVDAGARQAVAALLTFESGGGTDQTWGERLFALRWIGEPPEPHVAQAVYWAIRDRGPEHGDLDLEIIPLAMTPAGPQYRIVAADGVRR